MLKHIVNSLLIFYCNFTNLKITNLFLMNLKIPIQFHFTIEYLFYNLVMSYLEIPVMCGKINITNSDDTDT